MNVYMLYHAPYKRINYCIIAAVECVAHCAAAKIDDIPQRRKTQHNTLHAACGSFHTTAKIQNQCRNFVIASNEVDCSCCPWPLGSIERLPSAARVCIPHPRLHMYISRSTAIKHRLTANSTSLNAAAFTTKCQPKHQHHYPLLSGAAFGRSRLCTDSRRCQPQSMHPGQWRGHKVHG
jgi:hypothetical protein